MATGLETPVDIIRVGGTFRPTFLVAEGGNGANSGSIERIEVSGTTVSDRLELLTGLPSGVDPMGVTQGPAGMVLRGRRLYVAIGTGDTTVAGPTPGSEVPNPNGPSSPLLSSVLLAEFNAPVRSLRSSFVLTLAQQTQIVAGASVQLVNANGQTASVRLIGDLPDLESIPGRGLVRSNPFGLEVFPLLDRAYVPDASRNSLEEIRLSTGQITRVVSFPGRTNPTPIGPPTVEAVPAGAVRFLGNVLVPLETGFPFPPGVASIEAVALGSFGVSTLIPNLTNTLDVLPVLRPSGVAFFVIELGDITMFPPGPGRLLRFDGPSSSPVVISDTLFTPTSVAYDPLSRSLFVTEVFSGNLVRVVDCNP